MNPPDIRTTLLPKMLEQQQGGFRPERGGTAWSTREETCVWPHCPWRIHEPSRETFTSNHVRILLEKQVIFSLGDYENNFLKKRINRLSFHLWIVNVIQLRKLKKSSVLYVY